MKRVHVTVLVLACLALLADSMPLAGQGILAVSVQHLGGVTVLLYGVPVVLIIAAVIALNAGLKGAKTWYLSVAGAGLALSIVAIVGAFQHLEFFANMGGRFMDQGKSGESSLGLGAIMLVCGYGGILLVTLLGRSRRSTTVPGEPA